MRTKTTFILLFIYLVLTIQVMAQKTPPIVVKVDQPKAEIQPTMWGIFFEDINLAADGGIYAELVKNRSFEFFKPLMGWKITSANPSSDVTILNQNSVNAVNPRYAHIKLKQGAEPICLSNEGFRGMGIKKGASYHFSVLTRMEEGSSLKIRIELVDPLGNVIGKANMVSEGSRWHTYSVDFRATATEAKAKLNLWIEGKGAIDLDMVSLFPLDTWKKRPGGLRDDLVQLLADLKPGFLRFPGGCIVEGRELATRYQWKKTVGNVEDREMIVNRWNTEFEHRPTPDYFQTFGLGFFEYFQLSEDIGAEPLPILSCGMACQFNTAELVPLDQLDPYIQDALDLIEFANGPVSSTWGKVRADMGHPAPFNLKMIGVGNEQWGPQYIERYVIFEKAIKAKYPEIKIVSGTGPSPDGKDFTYAAAELKKLNAEIVDEHYYANPDWFLKNATRYDNYDRNSYKIFAGEYAAQSVSTCSPKNQNNWECALAEAAFMTGLERNAEVVHLASYAPLLAHIDGWQWKPDLIWFDNLTSFGSANYYVQKLFSNNKGTQVLPVLQNEQPLTGQVGVYASAAFDQKTNQVILKLVNTTKKAVKNDVVLEVARELVPNAKITVLKCKSLEGVNSLDQPTFISPIERDFELKGKTITSELAPYSFTVLRVKLAQ